MTYTTLDIEGAGGVEGVAAKLIYRTTNDIKLPSGERERQRVINKR